MENNIIVVKPNSLKSKDKEKLTKAGNIVIELQELHTGINIISNEIRIKYEFTCCYSCGERIYLTEERHKALKVSKKIFYCSFGHSQSFS